MQAVYDVLAIVLKNSLIMYRKKKLKRLALTYLEPRDLVSSGK